MNIVFVFPLAKTVYKMMLTDQKENLHEICAQWHENHHTNSSTYHSVIMHHWMRSGNTLKKVRKVSLPRAEHDERSTIVSYNSIIK